MHWSFICGYGVRSTIEGRVKSVMDNDGLHEERFGELSDHGSQENEYRVVKEHEWLEKYVRALANGEATGGNECGNELKGGNCEEVEEG